MNERIANHTKTTLCRNPATNEENIVKLLNQLARVEDDEGCREKKLSKEKVRKTVKRERRATRASSSSWDGRARLLSSFINLLLPFAARYAVLVAQLSCSRFGRRCARGLRNKRQSTSSLVGWLCAVRRCRGFLAGCLLYLWCPFARSARQGYIASGEVRRGAGDEGGGESHEQNRVV